MTPLYLAAVALALLSLIPAVPNAPADLAPSKPEADTPVLLVTGVINLATNTIHIESLEAFPNSMVDPPARGGRGTHRLLDLHGTLLWQMEFSLNPTILQGEGESPPSYVPVDVFIARRLPDLPDAFWLEVARECQALARLSIPDMLPRTAVLGIPDSGFTQHPAEQRQALLSQIAMLEQHLAAADVLAAWRELNDTIRPSLVQWLVDGYPVTWAPEFTKPEVLEVVDFVLDRLLSRLACQTTNGDSPALVDLSAPDGEGTHRPSAVFPQPRPDAGVLGTAGVGGLAPGDHQRAPRAVERDGSPRAAAGALADRAAVRAVDGRPPPRPVAQGEAGASRV